MRVLVTAKYFLREGAVYRRARQEVTALARAGHEVVVVCERVPDVHPEARALLEGPLASKIHLKQVAGVHERRWLPPKPVVLSLEVGFLGSAVGRARRLVRTADLLVCHSPSEAPLLVARRGRKVPTAVVLHSTMFGLEAAGLHIYHWTGALMHRAMERWLLPRLDWVVAVSGAVAKEAVALGVPAAAVHVLLNPVDVAAFETVPGATVTNQLLFAGRLAPEKGIDVLLDAVAILQARGIDASTVVAGEGMQHDTLAARVRAEGLPVTLVGWLTAPQLREHLSGSRVVVVPSRYEAQGVVVLEGMAAGRPVVASAVGGIPEVITSGVNGWLVPPGDAQALADRLAEVLADPGQSAAIVAAGLETARAHDLSAFERDVVTLYELIAQSPEP